jgi:hypothetical protein
MKAVDRAFAVVTGTRNLARPVLIRQELLAKFLERGCQEKKFSLDWKVGDFGLVIQPLVAPARKFVNRALDLVLSCVRAQRRAALER